MKEVSVSAIQARMREVGASMNPVDTEQVYAPLHALADTQHNVERDAQYGPSPRHLLDVAWPKAKGEGRPVLVFVHGGGFTSGERSRPGSPFHDNVMLWAAAQGMVGINITYRLAPEAVWPAGGLDVCDALHWVAEKVAQYGGDPGRVFVLGHSAGAAHVAQALAGRHKDKVPLAGAILLSGLYEIATAAPTPGRRAYFGDEPAAYDGREPIKGMTEQEVPIMFVTGALEPDEFKMQARHAFDTMHTAGRPVLIEELANHNHFSAVYSLGSEDASFSSLILSFEQPRSSRVQS